MDQIENSTVSFAHNSDGENLDVNFNTSYEFLDLLDVDFIPRDSNDARTSGVEPSDGAFATSTSEIMASPASPDLSENEVPVPGEIHKSVTDSIAALKNLNTELRQKNQDQESTLAEYEDKLAEQMDQILSLQLERTTLEGKVKALNKEKEELSVKYNEKMAELKQFKGLAKENEETKSQELQRNQESKQLKKIEKELQRSNASLNLETDKNKKIERFCKNLMIKLLKFGEKLKNSGLLSAADKYFLETVKQSCEDGTINCSLNLGELNVCVRKDPNVGNQHNFDDSMNIATSDNEVQNEIEGTRKSFLPFNTMNLLSSDEVVTSTPVRNLHGNLDVISHAGMLSGIERVPNFQNSDSSMVLPVQNYQDHKKSKLPSESERIPGNMPCNVKPKKKLSGLNRNGFETDFLCSDTEVSSFTEDDFDYVRKQVYIDENFMPLSPITSPSHRKSPVSKNNIKNQEHSNSHYHVAEHLHSTSINQNNITTPKKEFSKYFEKRNTFCHQTSRGFEPQVEESAIKSETSTEENISVKEHDNSTTETSENIPSNFHYISSLHMDNTTFIFNEGSAICDVLINTATGQSISAVTKTTPDLSSSNQSNNNSSILTSFFNNLNERRRNVMSLYQTARESSVCIKKEENSPLISPNPFTDPDSLSHIAGQTLTNDTVTVSGHSSLNFDSQLHLSKTKEQPNVPICLNGERKLKTPEEVEKFCQNSVYLQNSNCQQIFSSCENETNHPLKCFEDTQERSGKQLDNLAYHLPTLKSKANAECVINQYNEMKAESVCDKTIELEPVEETLLNDGNNIAMKVLQITANTSNKNLQESDDLDSSDCGNYKMHIKNQSQNNCISPTYFPSTPGLVRGREEEDYSVPSVNSSGHSVESKEKNILIANTVCPDSVSTDEELYVLENVKQNHSTSNEEYPNSNQTESEIKLQILPPATSPPTSLFENELLSHRNVMNNYAGQIAENKTEKISTKRNGIKRQRKVMINEANNTTASISPIEMLDSENVEKYANDAASVGNRHNSVNEISPHIGKKRKLLNDSAVARSGIIESKSHDTANKNIDIVEPISQNKNIEKGFDDNLFGQNKIEKANKPSVDENSTLLPCKSPGEMHESTSSRNAGNTSLNSTITKGNIEVSKMVYKQKSKADLNEISLKIRNQNVVKSLNQPLLGDNFSISKSLANVKHSPNATVDCTGSVGDNADVTDMQITQKVASNLKDNQNTVKKVLEDSESCNGINISEFKENNTLEVAVKPKSKNFDVSDIIGETSLKIISKPSSKKKVNFSSSNEQIKSEVNGMTTPFTPSKSKHIVLTPLKRSPRIAKQQSANTVRNRTGNSLLNKKAIKSVTKKSKKKNKKKKKKSKNLVSCATDIVQMKLPRESVSMVAGINLREWESLTNVDKAGKKSKACSKEQLKNCIQENSVCKTVKNSHDSVKTMKDIDTIQDTVGNCLNVSCTPVGQFSKGSNPTTELTKVNFSDSVINKTPLSPLTPFSPNFCNSQNKINTVFHWDVFNTGKCTETPLKNSTEKTQATNSPLKPMNSPNVISEHPANNVLTIQAEVNPLDSSNISETVDQGLNSPLKNGINSNNTSPANNGHTKGEDWNGLFNGSCKSDISDDENNLVIDEINEEEECAFEEESITTEKLIKASGNTAKRKHKINKKKVVVPLKKQCNGNVEGFPSIVQALEDLEKLKFDESHTKLLIHTLMNSIINPSNAPSARHAVFEIMKFLHVSKRNPFYTFSIKGASLVFPPLEHCIVESLIRIQAKEKSHLQGLIDCAINTLNYLVLSKDNIDIYGLCAFCRVLTSICKYLKNINRPVMLCSDLLKMKHKFAPFLIATIVGVWPDLFDVTENSSDLEMQFLSAIAYGVRKKPSTLHATQWKQCSLVFSKYLLAQPSDVTEASTTIMEQLKFVLEEENVENEFMLTDPLVIFSACEGWEWAQRNVLDNFIVPSLKVYADKKNDRGFSVLSSLYADTVLLSSHPKRYLQHMEKYFFEVNVSASIKSAAALSLLKIILKINIPVPDYLEEWISDNREALSNTPVVILLFKKRLIADSLDLTLDDVIS